MPALNFMKRFAKPVEDGTKNQTIRGYRKDGKDPKAGDMLQLYTGQRTSSCQLLKEAECKETLDVVIKPNRVAFPDGSSLSTPKDLDAFAKADGFDNWGQMREFFKPRGFPFKGLLIKW